MPNMFDNISVEKAPLTSGANSVNMDNGSIEEIQ